MSDNDLSEGEERRMAAKLMMGSKKPSKSRSKVKCEGTVLRFVQHVDRLTNEWLWCVVEQKGDKVWFEIERFEDRKQAENAADSYQRAGDKVEWTQKKEW